MSRSGARVGLGIAIAAVLGVRPADAQSLASRVAAAGDGRVRVSFAARPGVCGHGEQIHSTRRSIDWESDCERGPVRVVLTVRDREVRAVRAYVGGRWRDAGPGAVDLGTVPAASAADYLLGLAATLSGEPARDAILPATLAESATVWPTLLGIARDSGRPEKVRKAAVFWLGQEAATVATAGLEALVADEGERAVREHAIFALSQRPSDEGVPALIRIVRTNPDPALKKKALFWLGQSDDPRAIALFEEILTRG